jgi:hypothetical protein
MDAIIAVRATVLVGGVTIIVGGGWLYYDVDRSRGNAAANIANR